MFLPNAWTASDQNFPTEIWKFQLAVVLELIEISHSFPPEKCPFIFSKSPENVSLLKTGNWCGLCKKNQPRINHIFHKICLPLSCQLCVVSKSAHSIMIENVSPLAGSHNMKCLLVIYCCWEEVRGTVSLTRSQHSPGSPRDRFIELKAGRGHQII